jgi:HEAT repeat protein
VQALARRDFPGITQAMLGRLDDDSDNVRLMAALRLLNSPSPQALLTLTDALNRRPSLSSQRYIAEIAERLMTRYYLQIEPEERRRVRTTMTQFFPNANSVTFRP